ncbi:MAG: MerR family transcriptional regulator [Lactobacillus sp.]|nr:MerR family transcriptional regulator [Lactobacillus sp.]
MLVPISRVTKETGIEAHQLREWEKRHWLGDVLKDPENNNQRVYTEEQIKRIQLINESIQEQRKHGIKRTDLQAIEEKLLDRFGGEVKKMNSEVMVHPNSMEQMVEMITLQQKMIVQMQQQLVKLQQKELPAPIDYSETLSEMKNQLKFSEEREERLLELVEKLQNDVEELKKLPPKQRWKFWK